MTDSAQTREAVHTPEPWFADIPYIKTVADEPGPDKVIAECWRDYGIDEQWANARRIVACVNACAGIGTETLEDAGEGGINDDARRALEAIAALTAQRDALAEMPCCFAFVRQFVKDIDAEAWFPSLPDPPGECVCPPCTYRRTALAAGRPAETTAAARSPRSSERT